MSASGVSPGRLLRPFLALFALVFALEAGLYVEIMPWSFDAIETLTALIRADFIANFARPGAFHRTGFRLRVPLPRTGRRTARCAACSCRTAAIPPISSRIFPKWARRSKRTARPTCCCRKAPTQRPERSGDSAIVTFEDYAIDLSQFMHRGEAVKRPRELTTLHLIAPDPNDASSPRHGRAVARRAARPSGQPVLRLRRRPGRFRRARRSANHPPGPRRRDGGRGARLCRLAHDRHRRDLALRHQAERGVSWFGRCRSALRRSASTRSSSDR